MRAYVHSIDAQDHMAALGCSSDLNPAWGFRLLLRDLDRQSAGGRRSRLTMNRRARARRFSRQIRFQGVPSMGYLFLALALTLNASANILLKIGAARLGGLEGPNLIGRVASNYHLFAGLTLFALNVVFYVAALTRLNLSVAYPIMMAGGVVIVVSTPILFLQEAVTTRQMLGLSLLILGIVLVADRSLA